MRFETLECVVLERDIPAHGLRRGDLGTVVETYDPEGLEVEFVTASGQTMVVLTLTEHDVRKVNADDVLAARPTRSA